MEDLELVAQNYPLFELLQHAREQTVARFQKEIDIVFWPAYKLDGLGINNFYQSCYVFSLLSIFVLSAVMNSIRSSFLRKAFSTLLGIFFGFYVNGFGMFWVHLPAVVVYFATATLKRQHAYVVGYVLAAAIFLFGQWAEFSLGMGLTRITFFTCNMFQFVRLQMLLTNYRDAGQLDDKECRLTERERFYAEPLKDGPPGLLNMLHCTNFMVSSAGTGPVLEYRDVIEYLEVKGQSQNVPVLRCLIQGLRELVTAYLIGIVGRIVAAKFPPKYMWEESVTGFQNEPLWW